MITVRPAEALFESVVIEPGADVLSPTGALTLRFAVRDGAAFEVGRRRARAGLAGSRVRPATRNSPAQLPRGLRAATRDDGVPWTWPGPWFCRVPRSVTCLARREPSGAGTRVTEVWDVEQLPPTLQSSTQAQLDERVRHTEEMLTKTLGAIKATAEG